MSGAALQVRWVLSPCIGVGYPLDWVAPCLGGRLSDVAAVKAAADRLRDNVERVIVGKRDVVDLALVALLCSGHVLIEDVPGIGKTTLAKTLARSLGCSFKRVQFTPDLMPADITGINYYNQKSGEFEFRPGPILAQILLADEINRATPRTQSALLEAMEERQVTVDGVTMPLPRPFLVFATQNPVELEGTFPLPEAQLDRFLLRLAIGYPSEADEAQILVRFEAENPLESLQPVVSQAELLALQSAVGLVKVEDSVRDYVVQVSRATRGHRGVELGASPRATLALYRSSQAWAALHGRDYVLPDDVKTLAPSVLTHRLTLGAESRLRGHAPADVVKEVLSQVPVPVLSQALLAPGAGEQVEEQLGFRRPPQRGR
ncbi:MAG: MoxR family ATPase [Dehalococcoidia bacterium]|nr:MoxR family ATPase [Dehalococcoidia bacterium]